MEFFGGSSLAPVNPSTPQEIRFWAASSDGILRRNQLPESYTAIQISYPQTPSPTPSPFHDNVSNVAVFNNTAITNHHQDTHHFALEISPTSINQVPLPSPSLPSLPPQISASTAQLPHTNSISINGLTFPYYPLSTTQQHRPLKNGPILLKLGYDRDLCDLDLSVHIFNQNIIARGYVLIDHGDIVPQQQPPQTIRTISKQTESQSDVDNKSKAQYLRDAIRIGRNLAYGGDLIYNGPTYSMGLKYSSLDDFVGGHFTKSFYLDQLLPETASPFSTITPSIKPWLFPSAIDVGCEYLFKCDDGQDTFTLGAIGVWDEYHQGLFQPNTRQWTIQSLPPHQKEEQEQQLSTDIITTTTLPTSLYFSVNGIGAIGLSFTTSLYDELKRSSNHHNDGNNDNNPQPPSALSWLFSPFSNVLSTATSFPLNLFSSINSLPSPELLSHSAVQVSSRLEYSVGSRESTFNIGLQHINHTFQRNSLQAARNKNLYHENNIHHDSDNRVLMTPWSLTSSAQHTASLSSSKGLSYDYTISFSPPPRSQTLSNANSVLYYFNVGISKLLSSQYDEMFFRTHHAFPPLPTLQQPYQEIDATPAQQDPSTQALLLCSPSKISPLSWYPANYHMSEEEKNRLVYLAGSVNADDITRRLSLNSHNGEWKSLSSTGATPTPIWNPYDGIKLNFSAGFSF